MVTDIHLHRYFCKYADRQKVVRFGEFIYPTKDDDVYSKDTQDTVWPRSWDYYKEYQSIILLGPPRQGKTNEFQFQSSLLQNGFFLPLRELSHPEKPQDAFDDKTRERWDLWLQSDLSGELFIDALDEGKLDAPKLIKHIVRWLKGLGNTVLNRLRIHLSCRESDWTRIDDDAWRNLFPPTTPEKKDSSGGYVVLALLDLTESAVREYSLHKGVDPNSFLSDLPGHARSFLQRPQTLRMLLEEYSTTGRYARDLRELYERVIGTRLQEYNEYRQDFKAPDVPLLKKETIAEYYAVSTQMSAREIIAEFNADPLKHVPTGLSGDPLETERVVFSTSLFEWYSNGQYRFADPGLTDYLVARRLNELLCQGNISPEKITVLFFPHPEAEEVVPRLKNIVGWLCALDPHFRQEIIQRNPGLVLHDYVGNLSDDDRIAIWRWLVKQYAGREWFDYRQVSQYVGQLACKPLASNLRAVLCDKEHFGRDLRILATEIIRHGRLKALTGELTSIVKDPNENDVVRRYAATALAETAPGQLPVLKAWLDLPAEQDPDNDLLGTALDLLWPDYIDLETLITHLRPQQSDHFGRFWLFLSQLPTKLTPHDRARLLDKFARDIEEILQRYESGSEDMRVQRREIFHPVLEYDRFLSAQLKGWKDQEEKTVQLEQWLSILAEASSYGLITGTETQNIKEMISSEHQLRQRLLRQRVKGLATQEGDERIGVKLFLHNDLYLPQKEDLDFWKQVLGEWANQEEKLLEGAWECFEHAWMLAEYPAGVLDWLEEKSDRFPTVAHLWERDKICPYDPNSMKWRFKNAEWKRQEEEKRTRWKNFIRENVSSIREGNEKLLIKLFSDHSFGKPNTPIDKWIEEEEINPSVAQAFFEGLWNYWSNNDPPDIESIYLTNHVPWWSILVLLAVGEWVSHHGEDWTSLPNAMRQKALIAGLWELNKIPDWYPTLVLLEQTFAEQLFIRVFDMEAGSSDIYPRLANNLRNQGLHSVIRPMLFQYLVSHQNLRIQVALPMLQCVTAEGLSNSEADCLWEISLARYQGGDAPGALKYLASLWRFQPEQVWKWLNENHLAANETRKSHFDEWISAIEDVYLGALYHGWPGWVDEKTLLEMLPDLYVSYPPEDRPDFGGIQQW